MSSSTGKKLKVQLFGQSHSKGLGVVIDGLPAGEKIDMKRVEAFLEQRAGGKNPWSTKRKEPDMPKVLSGLIDDTTCGAPLCVMFENTDIKEADYETIRSVPRPSHADYTAWVKHSGFNDAGGGGHFSGRLTLPLCFAGAICLQLLERKGVTIEARIFSIGNISDAASAGSSGNDSGETIQKEFPVYSKEAGDRMIDAIKEAASAGDSLGGVVECVIRGLPPGLGDPIFDNLESRLSYALFAIPAVKGVEFGAGFESSKKRGSEYNDQFCIDEGVVKTKTNNAGGILGGISNGMPIVFRTAFKPTPSISIEQQSVNLLTGEEVSLNIKGRHDPCIVPRAVPCVMAAAAIVITDVVLGG